MNFVLIAVCLIAGIILRSTKGLPENAHKGINAWILYIALPAMSLLYIPAIEWSTALILPAAMPIAIWAAAWASLKFFGDRISPDKQTQAALLLTAGLGNTSFIGFPLTEAYLGHEGLRIAVICDQVNFIALSAFGVMTALKAAHSSKTNGQGVLKTLIRFPPFFAFVAALILPRFMNLDPIAPLLTRLGNTLVPLALFSVGLQIHFSEWRRELRCLTAGLAYKLIVAPAMVLGAALLFHVRGFPAQASILEAAMAPMITSAILASEYRLNPRLSNLMVSVGTLISIATTYFWFLVSRALVSG
jgi:predicted permease